MKTFDEYKKSVNIMYIEDDVVTSNKVKSILSKFYNKIIIASNGEEALNILDNLESNFDVSLIISDINMPRMDGLEFLEKIRNENNHIPFIFVTARSEPDKMLKAIQLDIDNYILKPIELKNFLTTIDKSLEKSYENYVNKVNQKVLRLTDDLKWNCFDKRLFLDSEEIKLTKKELLLVDLLITNANKIFSIDDIVSELWEEEFDDKDYIANLKNIISRLRNKIPQLNIENVYGMGYKISLN